MLVNVSQLSRIAGCAHGFQALTDPADVSYRIDRPHDPSEDVSIAFDDPELAIPWPLAVTIMSQRDQVASSLAAATKLLAACGPVKVRSFPSQKAPSRCRKVIRHHACTILLWFSPLRLLIHR